MRMRMMGFAHQSKFPLVVTKIVWTMALLLWCSQHHQQHNVKAFLPLTVQYHPHQQHHHPHHHPHHPHHPHSKMFQPSSTPRYAALTTPTSSDLTLLREIFPVLSKIQGINWKGTCRYVNQDLQPQTKLLLTGGTRYDLELLNGHDNDNDGDASSKATCTLTSFLTFPNGQTRQVQMKGTRGNLQRSSMRLDPVLSLEEEENGGGPPATTSSSSIYMVLTEVAPDTILLQEVEQETGRIILTSSLSIPSSSSGRGNKELIQTSHELGVASKESPSVLEGHQLWRYTPLVSSSSSSSSTSSTSPSSLEGKSGSGSVDENPETFRGATGR